MPALIILAYLGEERGLNFQVNLSHLEKLGQIEQYSFLTLMDQVQFCKAVFFLLMPFVTCTSSSRSSYHRNTLLEELT